MPKSKRFTLLTITLFVITLLAQSSVSTPQHIAVAQTSHTTVTLVEDFANGSNPPILNQFNFNHSFTLNTAWDLGGITLGDPVQQTPPYALTLYSGNEDRITFNQPNAFSYVQSAQVWGYAYPAENGVAAGRGRVTFEGTGDNKTFSFVGGVHQWRPFAATAADVGDNGNVLGEITAVTLEAVSVNEGNVMFDDLEVESVTPPTRSNLALTMTGSATMLNVGDTITYDITVTNSGPQDAPNTQIYDVLPTGSSFVANSSSGLCSLQFGQLVCNLGTLAVNASRTVTIAAQVGADACTTFNNRATVTAQALDSNMANNTAVHAATSQPACADFAVSQTALPVPPMPGEDDLTYTITIENKGPDTAGSSLSFTVPQHVHVTAVAHDSGMACSETNDVVSCSLDPLVGGQSKQIYVTGSTLAIMNGIQMSEAIITPAIPDPDPTNNISRFRFSSDPAYDFTIIGELGVDELAAYDYAENIVINNSGQVAFYVTAGSFFQPTAFGVFRGDGTTPLVPIVASTDFPVLPVDQYREIGTFGELDMNHAGTVAFIEKVKRDLGSGHETITTTIHSGNGGPLTTVDSDGNDSGTGYRQYQYATINNRGRVVATYDNRLGQSAVLAFENGQETVIATEQDFNHYFKSVGQSDDDDWIAYQQDKVIGPGMYDTLYRTHMPANNPQIVVQTTGSFNDLYSTHHPIRMTNQGRIIYSQVALNPNTGQGVESLKLDNQVLLSEFTINGRSANFNSPAVNNEHRYLFYTTFSSQFGTNGFYTGPHPVANRVVRANLFRGDLLFGSRVIQLHGAPATGDINDSGQVAFIAGLANGRILILRADPIAEQDQDGVNDWTELGAANQGDGNSDGIPDSAQPHVASPTTFDGVYPITFAVDPNQTLANVAAIPNPSPSDTPNAWFPLGHFSFEVQDLIPGAAAEVTIFLPSWVTGYQWWKYGPTPNNPSPHWYEFSYDGTTGAEFNGNIVTLHLVDGGRGDDDLSANGIIVDPGALAGYPYAVYLPTIQK